VDWGNGVEVLTRAMCGGCQELKRQLTEAGIPFRELDVDTVDGRAAWAWHDSPELLPAVAVDGRLLDAAGDVDALFAAVTRLRRCG
jgi:glutaredoxin